MSWWLAVQKQRLLELSVGGFASARALSNHVMMTLQRLVVLGIKTVMVL